MKKSKRLPYTRLATDDDKQAWCTVFAPLALMGFVQVTESGVTHWAAVVRNAGIIRRHTLHGLCSCLKIAEVTQNIEVNCMTCIVRIARGPRAP